MLATHQWRFELQLLRFCLLLPALSIASAAIAADAGNGQRIAEMRCVTCHMVGADRRREVADAPPFEVIARKFAVSPEILAFSMLEPHPKMNVTLTRREAEDIAAYIGSLVK
jgi:mono/diheme cytochrome c family protein